MKELESVFVDLDKRLKAYADECSQLGGRQIEDSKLRILGQTSLLLNPSVVSKLMPFATKDVDALILGESSVCRKFFKEVLATKGLVYDDLSKEIWLPRNSKFTEIFRGVKLSVEVIDPISTLVSKAVKAPDKNQLLIERGIEVFGDKLVDELKFYNVDIDRFSKGYDFNF